MYTKRKEISFCCQEGTSQKSHLLIVIPMSESHTTVFEAIVQNLKGTTFVI